MDRLVIRNGGTLTPSKPKVEVGDLGLALYSVEPISNNHFVKVLTQSRLKIAETFSLDTAFLATSGNDPDTCSLIDGEDLQKAGFAFSFHYSESSPDCKKFIEAAVNWADRKGKTWIALAGLGSVITIPFLQEIQDRLPGPINKFGVLRIIAGVHSGDLTQRRVIRKASEASAGPPQQKTPASVCALTGARRRSRM